MLLRVLLCRLCPLIPLWFCKDSKQMKWTAGIVMSGYMILLLSAVIKVIAIQGLKGVLTILLSMFPQYVFYGLSMWMIGRCVWYAWSERVWRRIFFLSVISILIGIFAETYWNPGILQGFYKILK